MKDSYLNELTKNESKAIQGVAILCMLVLHLFCRYDNLPYTVFFYIGEIPLIYYLGLWGDQCVALFCFCAGYASYLYQEKYDKKRYADYSVKRIIKLLINYWIIVILFSLIGLLLGKGDLIPGSFIKFLCNFFMISSSYNGAWWFLLTYLLLVAISRLLYNIVKKHNSAIVFFESGIIYFIAYIIRFDIFIVPDKGEVFNWFIRQSVLLGTSVFPYVLGMIFYKNLIISRIRKIGDVFPRFIITIFSMILLGGCIITHGIKESLILAPIYAMITVCAVSLWKGKVIIALKNIGEHSNNIWLIHMFYYNILFDGFIFRFRYPVLIFMMMLCICLVSSIFINFILRNILSYVRVRENRIKEKGEQNMGSGV